MLNSEELKDLIKKVCDKVSKEIDVANRVGDLTDYLRKIDCSDLLRNHMPYSKGAKILVIGKSEISEEEMKRIAIESGINPKNMEFELDYKKNKHFDYSKLKNNTGYSDVIFGPVAHKGVNIGDNSSAITLLENDPESYPNVVRADANSSLKITRNSFRIAITKTQAYKDLLGY